VASIGTGVVVLLGVCGDDTDEKARWLARKIAGLRIFEDRDGLMNIGLDETGGEALVVSQFTLYGDCTKGRRPSFGRAAPPVEAERLYEVFVQALRDEGIKVRTGRFQARMLVTIDNDGPVTLVIER
jgi:D-tyrosyl-tRNA(Tyr) deacylase